MSRSVKKVPLKSGVTSQDKSAAHKAARAEAGRLLRKAVTPEDAYVPRKPEDLALRPEHHKEKFSNLRVSYVGRAIRALNSDDARAPARGIHVRVGK